MTPAASRHMADAKNHCDGQRQRHRKADERTEGHDVQQRQRPGVLVLENGVLVADVGLHFTEGGQLHD